jgi:hypothetical protein
MTDSLVVKLEELIPKSNVNYFYHDPIGGRGFDFSRQVIVINEIMKLLLPST